MSTLTELQSHCDSLVDAPRVREGIPGLLHPHSLCSPHALCAPYTFWDLLLVYLGSVESPGDWPLPGSAAGPCPLCQTRSWCQVTAPCLEFQSFPPPWAQPAAPKETPAPGVFLNRNRPQGCRKRSPRLSPVLCRRQKLSGTFHLQIKTGTASFGSQG